MMQTQQQPGGIALGQPVQVGGQPQAIDFRELGTQFYKLVSEMVSNPTNQDYYNRVLDWLKNSGCSANNAQRLVAGLLHIINPPKEARQVTTVVPTQCALALETLFKAIIINPFVYFVFLDHIIHPDEARKIRLDKFVRFDETKNLALNFFLLISRMLGTPRYMMPAPAGGVGGAGVSGGGVGGAGEVGGGVSGGGVSGAPAAVGGAGIGTMFGGLGWYSAGFGPLGGGFGLGGFGGGGVGTGPNLVRIISMEAASKAFNLEEFISTKKPELRERSIREISQFLEQHRDTPGLPILKNPFGLKLINVP